MRGEEGLRAELVELVSSPAAQTPNSWNLMYAMETAERWTLIGKRRAEQGTLDKIETDIVKVPSCHPELPTLEVVGGVGEESSRGNTGE
ncbi:MAG: hypothetical protein Q9210_001373 [Variospora velana]